MVVINVVIVRVLTAVIPGSAPKIVLTVTLVGVLLVVKVAGIIAVAKTKTDASPISGRVIGVQS
jgi:hypothetical protein